MPNVSVPGMLTGLELRKPELTRPCEMELPEQLRDFPPSPPRPEQLRDFSPSEKPLDCRDLLPSYRSVMLISSKPEGKKSKNSIFRCCPDPAFLQWLWIRIGSGFHGFSGSVSGSEFAIRIHEGKNDPQTWKKS
jgi:hypothetical protein